MTLDSCSNVVKNRMHSQHSFF